MQTENSFYFPPGSVVDTGAGFHGLRELADLRLTSLFPARVDAIAELIGAQVLLAPSESIPLHVHPHHSEGIFVLRGTVMGQRGRAKAELRTRCAAYIPAGVPHAVSAVGEGDAAFLMFYPRADISRDVTSELVKPDADQSEWPDPNVVKGKDLLWRWAVAEESEPWITCEPTKGLDVAVRFLFDPPRGAPDMVIGTGMTEANWHYTIHRHAPAEFYYVLAGHGTYYVGDQAYQAVEGSTLYVPANMPHGCDASDVAINDFWVYGLDGSGDDWVWEAQEAIYNVPRPKGHSNNRAG